MARMLAVLALVLLAGCRSGGTVSVTVGAHIPVEGRTIPVEVTVNYRPPTDPPAQR